MSDMTSFSKKKKENPKNFKYESPSRSREQISKVYNLKQNLGKGAFGSVREATLKLNPKKDFAVKVISKRNTSKSGLRLFLKEVELLKYFDHPYIVKFYEVYENKNNFYLVQEVLRGGELNNRLSLRHGKLDEKEAKKYMYQMLLSVNYLHGKKIAHRDLKPENFMFKEIDGQELKLIDFGLSTNCRKNE